MYAQLHIAQHLKCSKILCAK